MSFGQPMWFWGLALLPLLLVLYARRESRRAKLLQQLVAARLFERLAGTVNLPLRRLRFALFLLGLAALVVSLAQPRYGYTWEESKRQGRDVIVAIDCSRSMLATDLPPSRLARAKLATQDLIEQLPGDRVGLIAFAGTAFLQAPLTIDYGAVLNSLAEFDPDLIPRGGTNIAAAITEADAAFGKGESDNRCLILFTDGEELEADAVMAANAEKDHMKIFTVGIGSADGSLIPVPAENGGTTFVKDENGQFVKSRLDEDRLRKIAESTGGFYVHLQNGPAEMKQIVRDGLGQMKQKEFDARMSRRPIERYQWPLSAALVLLVASTLIGERKRMVKLATVSPQAAVALAIIGAFFVGAGRVNAKNPGLELYEKAEELSEQKDWEAAHKQYEAAREEFSHELRLQPSSPELNFNLGVSAYKLGEDGEALNAFSKALLADDPTLQRDTQGWIGNTLYRRGTKLNDRSAKLKEWKGSVSHYDEALKIDPKDELIRRYRDFVQKKIDDLEKEPPKSDQQQQEEKKDDQKKDQQDQQQQQQQNKSGGQKDQQQQQQSQGGQKDKDQQQQSQQSQGQQSQNQQSQSSGQQQQKQQGNAQQDKDQSGKEGQQNQPQPQNGGKGEEKQNAQSNPSPGNQQSPQQQKDGQGEQRPPPTNEPSKKFSGEVGAQGNAQPDPQQEAAAEAEAAQEGKMTQAQARTLLESLKGEDKRVQFSKPEGKPLGRTFRDW